MTVDVTVSEPTHHISLIDADSTIKGLILCNGEGDDDLRGITKSPYNRMGLRIMQGAPEWGDQELPYQSETQDNWSGGAGLYEFQDRERYWHGFGLNTMHSNKVILGPQHTITTGYRDQNIDLVGNMSFQALHGSTRYVEAVFTAGANYSADADYLWLKVVGTPGTLTIELTADSGGDPDTVHKTVTQTYSSDVAVTLISKLYKADWTTTQALTNGTDYHIKVYGAATDDADDHWLVGVLDTTASTQYSSDGSSWSAASYDLAHRVVDADTDFIGLFFEYKGALYFVRDYDDGTTSTLWLNGDRGIATGTQSATTIQDTGKTWTADEHIGKVVYIPGGTGIGQWREITDNDTNTLTVATWKTTPVAASSEYVILGDNTWTEIGTTGLTGPITDVKVVKDVVYFMQGEAVNIRRFQYDAGSNSFADDGTNKATFMQLVHESGGAQIYKANNAAVSTTVAKADPHTWAEGNLSFGTAIDVGNSDSLITGVERYGDPEYLWIFKEDSVYRIVGDTAYQLPLREMEGLKSQNNGRAHAVSGVYLYFSMMKGGVERYYQSILDDMGPNVDDGMPQYDHGPVYHMLSFPGRIYACIGDDQWPSTHWGSIRVFNGLGWHPIFINHEKGVPIRRIHLQTIPGETQDRLWYSAGSDIVWLSMPSETLDPTEDSNYRYHHDGMLQLSLHNFKLKDVQKTYDEVRVFAEGLSTGAQYITGRYSIDNGSTFTDFVDNNLDTSPVDESQISTSTSQIQNENIWIHLFLHSTSQTVTPVLRAVVLDAVAHIPTKFQYSVTFRAADENEDLRGDEESASAASLISQLETWANAGNRLTLRHHAESGPLDNKLVWISAPVTKPLDNIDDDNETEFICEMSIFEA